MMSHHQKLVLLAVVGLLFSAAVADASLVALYQFEDDSGTVGSTIADTSGNLQDGTVTGDAITLAPGQTGYGNAAGFGSGFVQANLTGVASIVNDFTIAFWMQSNDTSQSQTYITSRSSTNPQQAAIYGYAYDGGVAQTELFPDGRPGSQITIPDTGWHHVVYTRSGTDYDYYLDGVKTDIGLLSGPITPPSGLSIGAAWNSAGKFNGQVDDVAWFDNGLDQAEVNTIMGGNFDDFKVTPPGTAGPPVPVGAQVFASSYVFPDPAAQPGTGGNNTGSYDDPGLTELTDDDAQNYVVWPGSITDVGPLVGWASRNPTITFNFASPEEIDTVIAYLADSDGVAGVGLPTLINLSTSAGFSQNFVVTNPPGSGTTVPLAMSGLGLTTDNITLTAFRGHEWTMATEVEFYQRVPEPGSLVLLALGSLGLLLGGRRRRRAV